MANEYRVSKTLNTDDIEAAAIVSKALRLAGIDVGMEQEWVECCLKRHCPGVVLTITDGKHPCDCYFIGEQYATQGWRFIFNGFEIIVTDNEQEGLYEISVPMELST